MPELLCLGHIDAAVAYLNNEPLQLQNRMMAADCGDVNWTRVFPVTEVADLVSNSVVSNEMTIERHPQLVEAFVTAFDRGVLEVIANPAAAMLISAEYVEGLVSPEVPSLFAGMVCGQGRVAGRRCGCRCVGGEPDGDGANDAGQANGSS